MIRELAEKLNFPQEAIDALVPICQMLHENKELRATLTRAIEGFVDTPKESYPLLDELAEKTGYPRESIDMVFLLLCAAPLYERYRKAGLSDKIYYETLGDLRCKLLECWQNRGIWGTFVTWWYPGFYQMTRFALGRLQYERIEFPYDGYKGLIKKGDTVINCHIPSSGALSPESVLDSLRQAYAFYAADRKNGLLPVYCSSWMLSPIHKELYPKGSNLLAFYELFDTVESRIDEANSNFWRIFGMSYSPDTLGNAPEDTTLRRNFKRHLLAGNCMGSARAILLFDGERIVKAL